MAQFKKKAVHEAIVASATALFSEQGYTRTTLGSIAARAGIGVGSVYSYFPSKLELLYEIYRPWFQNWFAALEIEVRATASPKQKLRTLLIGFWHGFPAQNPGLANSLMEALASEDPVAAKPDDLIQWTEQRLTELLREILPPQKHAALDGAGLAHAIVMAQDGFVINYRLGKARDSEALARQMTDLILD